MSHFTITCPTSIRFGPCASSALTSLLATEPGIIAFARGSSGTASGSIAAALERARLPLIELRVTGEPSLSSVNAAFEACRGAEITHVIACGGGSVIDTGKALAVCLSRQAALPADFSDIPQEDLLTRGKIRVIAIPTTAGTGAEVTSNAVVSLKEACSKTSLRGATLFPDIALIDPDLLASAPKAVLLSSGLDALVQTNEAYTSRLATPFSDALTESNIDAGLHALRRVIEGPGPDDWPRIAWVSLTSGLALANSGLGAAHGLAAVLGVEFDAPHGALCGRLIAPVLERNRQLAGQDTPTFGKIDHCYRAIGDQFPSASAEDPLAGFETWVTAQGLPRLRDYGVTERALPKLAERARTASSTTKNAITLDTDDLSHILRKAF